MEQKSLTQDSVKRTIPKPKKFIMTKNEFTQQKINFDPNTMKALDPSVPERRVVPVPAQVIRQIDVTVGNYRTMMGTLITAYEQDNQQMQILSLGAIGGYLNLEGQKFSGVAAIQAQNSGQKLVTNTQELLDKLIPLRPRYEPFTPPDLDFRSIMNDCNNLSQHMGHRFRPPERYKIVETERTTIAKLPPGVSPVNNVAKVYIVDFSKPLQCSYTPSYFVATPDYNILKVMNNLLLAAQEEPEAYVPSLYPLFQTLNSHYYGSGCPQGQLGRYNAVKLVRNAFPQRKHYKADWFLFYQIDVTRNYQMLNMTKYASLADYIVAQKALNYSLGNTTEIDFINGDSATGPWIDNKVVKNSDVMDEIFCVTEQFIREAYRASDPQDEGIDGAMFEERWLFLTSAQLKPKPEVYLREEFSKKTRNILAMCQPAALLAQMVQAPIFKSHKPIDISSVQPWKGSFYDPDGVLGPSEPPELCLLGFNPTKGFMEELHEIFTDMSEGQSLLLFMSDNLFICDKRHGKVRWVSLDGSKMEASHDMTDAQDYIKFILSLYKDPETGDDLMDEGLKRAYTFIAERCMVNVSAIWGTFAVRIEQLSSGYQHTSGLNSIKMAKIVYQIYQTLLYLREGKGELAQDLIESANVKHLESGREARIEPGRYKEQTIVELYDLGLIDHCFDSEAVIMKVEFRNDDVLGELNRTGYSELDLLGFAMHAHVINGSRYILPVLSTPRLVKAMLFSKIFKSLSQEEDEQLRDQHQATVSISKLNSLWIFGGYQQMHGLRQILSATYQRCYSYTRGKVDIDLFSKAFTQSFKEFGAEIPPVTLFPSNLPSFSTIVRIMCREETYQKFVNSVVLLKQNHIDLLEQLTPKELLGRGLDLGYDLQDIISIDPLLVFEFKQAVDSQFTVTEASIDIETTPQAKQTLDPIKHLDKSFNQILSNKLQSKQLGSSQQGLELKISDLQYQQFIYQEVAHWKGVLVEQYSKLATGINSLTHFSFKLNSFKGEMPVLGTIKAAFPSLSDGNRASQFFSSLEQAYTLAWTFKRPVGQLKEKDKRKDDNKRMEIANLCGKAFTQFLLITAKELTGPAYEILQMQFSASSGDNIYQMFDGMFNRIFHFIPKFLTSRVRGQYVVTRKQTKYTYPLTLKQVQVQTAKKVKTQTKTVKVVKESSLQFVPLSNIIKRKAFFLYLSSFSGLSIATLRKPDVFEHVNKFYHQLPKTIKVGMSISTWNENFVEDSFYEPLIVDVGVKLPGELWRIVQEPSSSSRAKISQLAGLLMQFYNPQPSTVIGILDNSMPDSVVDDMIKNLKTAGPSSIFTVALSLLFNRPKVKVSQISVQNEIFIVMADFLQRMENSFARGLKLGANDKVREGVYDNTLLNVLSDKLGIRSRQGRLALFQAFRSPHGERPLPPANMIRKNSQLSPRSLRELLEILRDKDNTWQQEVDLVTELFKLVFRDLLSFGFLGVFTENERVGKQIPNDDELQFILFSGWSPYVTKMVSGLVFAAPYFTVDDFKDLWNYPVEPSGVMTELKVSKLSYDSRIERIQNRTMKIQDIRSLNSGESD